jgi:hypothetical protein
MADKKDTNTKRTGSKPAASKPAASKPAPAKSTPAKRQTPKSGAKAKPAATAGGAAKPKAAKPAPSTTRAAKPAPSAGEARKPADVPAASEANPLHKKLRLRSEDKGLIVAPPPDAENPLLPLPKGFAVVNEPSSLAPQKGPFDYVHVFARDRVELAETLSLLSQDLAPGGSLWVSWMKPSSKLKGGGQPGDLNETIVRRIGLTRGLVDMNLVSLDRDWGALRLIRRR